MRAPTRWLHIVIPLLLLSAVTAFRFQYDMLVERVQLPIFDLYQRLYPRPYQATPVKILDIDEASIAKLGQWPWPRRVLADLITRAHEAGAVVVAFDAVFPEHDRTSPNNVWSDWPESPERESARALLTKMPDHDVIFADTIAQSNVVLGYQLVAHATNTSPIRKWGIATAGDDPRQFVRQNHRGAVVSLPALQQAAAGNGSFTLAPEHDNIVRRVHVMFRLGNALYPSLAAETLRTAQGASSYVIKSSGASMETAFGEKTGINSIKIGQFPVPTDAQGRFWLHHTRHEPSRYLPVWQLFDASADLSALDGAIAFVGFSAAGLRDLVATPLNPTTPGVEIHAAIIEQVLLSAFLHRPDWARGAELVYMIALGATLIFLVRRRGAVVCAVLGAIAVVIAIGTSWLAFKQFGMLLDPIGPSLAVLLIYLLGSGINYAQSESERRFVRTAFEHYLAPTVIQDVLDDPSRLSSGGEKRITTSLFTDVAGFTSLAENREPAELVHLLNDYLDGACSIVLEHNGTIDKIVGDAVHVFFNAPGEQPDHAQRAVQCALALDRFCHKFAQTQNANGIPLGETRIGVNTGPTVVGNFGGETRFDYTAHGDAINTAARLESANKVFGTRICVSEATKLLCTGIIFRPIASLRLKGKSDYIDVFEPLVNTSDDALHLQLYNDAYALMAADDSAAVASFAQLSNAYPDDPLAAFHARRLARSDGRRREGESGSRIVMREK